MVVVRDGIVLGGRMLVAARTDFIAGKLDFRRVGIVAVGAANALMEHLALEERAVLVHLVQNLSVGVVRLLAEQLAGVVVVEPAAGGKTAMNGATARVARRARFDLGNRRLSLDAGQGVAALAVPKRRKLAGELH